MSYIPKQYPYRPKLTQDERLKLKVCKYRYARLRNSGKYTEVEVHDMATLLCIIRDTNREELRERCEACLNSFIRKRKLGIPTSLKKLRQIFMIG